MTSPWPVERFNGKDYYQVQTTTLMDIDPDGQTFFMVGTPAGGIGAFGPIAKGDPGKHSVVDGTVVLTVLEPDDPTPDSVSWEELTPGSDTTSQVVREHRTVHKAPPGNDGTTAIDLSTIAGTAAAGRIIEVNTGATNFKYASRKVGDRFYASSITGLSSSAAGTLGTVALGPFDFDAQIECHGSAIITGSSSDVAVDLVARLGSSAGNVIARGMGIAGASPVAAHRLGSDVLPGDIAVGGPDYDHLAAGATTTVYFRAERVAGSGTFSIPNTRASFWVKVNALASPAGSAGGLRTTSWGQLVEANGTPLILRGSQYPHAYMSSYGLASTIIGQVAAHGANAIRIQITVGISAGGYWDPPNDTDIPTLISLCKANDLILVITSADATGHNPDYSMTDDVAMWIRHKADLVGQEDYVIINLASEYYDTAHIADWQAGTIAGIQAMRAAGFRHTLIVDAPDNAASDFEWYMRNNAPTIVAADPLHNTVCSVHMYNTFASIAPIAYEIDQMVANGVPFVVGEFGNNIPDTTVDTLDIMAHCQAKNIGYLAFAWTGSATPGSGFDQWNYSTSALTTQGDEVFNSTNGIVATSQLATIFNTVPKTETLTDTFATKDTTKWVWDTGADVVTAHLQITPSNAYPAIRSKQRYDLTGSSVLIECTQVPNVENFSIGTFLQVYSGPFGTGSGMQIGWYAGTLFCMDNDGHGTTFTTRYSATWDGTAHKWWRMREFGGIVYWDVSPSGATGSWTQVAAHALSGFAACTVSVNAGFFLTEPTPGLARFANFNTP